jgi:hypothetical protein
MEIITGSPQVVFGLKEINSGVKKLFSADQK